MGGLNLDMIYLVLVVELVEVKLVSFPHCLAEGQ